MAKDKNDSPLTPDEPEVITLTREEFEALKKGKSDVELLATSITSAMQDARKPYVSEGELANQRNAQEAMKRLAASQRAAKKWDQDHCPHIKGCNPLSDSLDTANRSAFIRHRLDTGATFLMCTNCQKVIWQDDPEFQIWYNKPSGNRPSAGGDRFQSDPLKAMREGRLEQPDTK
jgi:hypothetical protein